MRWKKRQAKIDPARLVFIDETWTKTNMAPLRGWNACGKRLIGKAPHGHWRTQTFLAALRCDRIEAPCVFDGPINGLRFLTYVREFLLPSLKAGDVVIAATNFVRAGTISAATRERPFARPSAASAPNSSSCRHTVPISTRSSRSSPSSNTGFENPQSARSRPSAIASEHCSIASSLPSAEITSRTQGMLPTKMITL
jgi:hypothetical protein